ncbi:MAG: 16S rRNA (guanine(527)-N(7))-methyltransferase RsmG [Elusimicrobia bacterium]|nr:16S rRNA (guanine(527)-N(7))-methyltransferase RsmG [Elusimicrobiota bacterium]
MKEIEEVIREYDIEISPSKINSLEIFLKELSDKNRRINLISKNDETKLLKRHLIDSLLIMRTGFISDDIKKIIDIGSGGGFPGVVMAVVYSNIKITLAEKIRKKALFLLWIKQILKLDNLDVLNREITRKEVEEYDAVTQRASGKIDEIYPLAMNLLCSGGSFISWMSPDDISKFFKAKPDAEYRYLLDDKKERSISLFYKK